MLKAISLFASLFAFASGIAFATSLSNHEIILPKHGTLTVSAPETWRMDVSQPPNQLPPTIKFSQAAGDPFVVLMTPLWKIGSNAPPLGMQGIMNEVQTSANDAAPHSVEGKLKIEQLTGGFASGYYFSATDSEPLPG